MDTAIYERFCRKMAGRALLGEEVARLLNDLGEQKAEETWTSYAQRALAEGRITCVRGIGRERKRSWFGLHTFNVSCRRCGSGIGSMRATPCAACGQQCLYCEACLGMGRVRSCTPIFIGKTGPRVSLSNSVPDELTRWGLSRAQASAVRAALSYLERPDASQFLIWAVTGAGKTEMLFPLLERTVSAGGFALVATPRQDVVKELQPRLAKAFPGIEVTALYGGSGSPWDYGQITVATTHQLLRFRHAFDLVVIDELDAFPYLGDPMLHVAARQAGKPGAPYIFLSATPPKDMRRAARKGRLPHVKVPARFHGHPLPVPRRVPWQPPRHSAARVSRRLARHLSRSLERGAQVFVFVPRIDMVDPLAEALQRAFPDIRIEGTSSQDEERGEKVMRFRRRETRVLVTTTILERGVTVPKSDVFILDASAPLFDEAALVQMAGRAGRSAEDPEGRVLFFSPCWTRSQRAAIRHIRRMNREAQRKGYLKPKEPGTRAARETPKTDFNK